jgi:pimeloyl-ACP methyl ester carboxylesterase
MASLEQWSPVQTALGSIAPVVSYDRVGTGFSDPPDAYDAYAGADELDQFLHSAEITGPIVIVSYSSSSMQTIVFAARHPDVVKGIIFVDPIVWSRSTGTKSYRRILLRPAVINSLKAFLGLTRLKLAIPGSITGSLSEVSERANMVFESTHHWLASAHDAMSLDESVREADAAMAIRPFTHLPIRVLTTIDPKQSEYFHGLFERQRRLAESSEQSALRVIHSKHSQLMDDPLAIDSIVDQIRTIVDEVRTRAATGGTGLP